METISRIDDWNIEQVIEDLDQQGFAIIDHAYTPDYLKDLVYECQSNLVKFRDAAIQNGVVNNIRSDHILWIEENLPRAQQHIEKLQTVAHALNRAFYSSIKEVEAHFACYNAGEFYALHRDNPQNKNGRVISSVFYLHQHWQDEWGGQLRLQDKHLQWHIIAPQSNRIVFFQSDLLHEVLLSKQQRLSITAWLRTADQPW